ncbi:MAG: AgmX/PglI C-terminal domain-containing protein [Kofleriaceae bacterium]|nr:AgmX/PglI C-terminal domain-containing protein [Kofleriaceae bacterium]
MTPALVAIDEPPPIADAVAPWSLTASDGSGLVLSRVDAKAVVQGPLAFTELHLYFKNPEDRIREGTFAITLPSGAAVSRFAMENNGAFQEAEVIEKAVARRVYDDFLHRKQDPALLEKAAGNQFTARVFPIGARADKHLVVSFSQELAGRAYRLPLRGLPRTARVDVVLAATRADGTRYDQTLAEKDWQPDRDFVGEVPSAAAAVTDGMLVVATLPATGANAATADPPKELTLLVDTSASRALGFASYVRSIHSLVTSLRAKYGDPLSLRVVAFDQDTQTIFDGVAADYGAAQDDALVARGAAGASDLAQAIHSLGARPSRRVVVVTDGVMTAGPDTPDLVAAVKALPIERLDVVLAGGIRDERVAAAVARAGLPHAGDVLDLDRGIEPVVAALGQPVLTDIAIDVPGATWVYPRSVVAARPGSPLVVFAKLPKPSRSFDVVVGGTRRTIVPLGAAPALVERAVASAEIDELETRLAQTTEDKAAKVLRADIAQRSVKSRVISSQTSMLVLETEDDYKRYKIERTALADILVIGKDGKLEQSHRSTFIAAKQKPRPKVDARETGQLRIAESHESAPDDRAEAIDEARSAGTLGASNLVEGGSFASLTGTADTSSGFDDTNVYGGLLGNEGATASGFGAGGGGTGWGTIGTGRYGTIGRGAGTGSGYGVAGGRGGMRARTAAAPIVSTGQLTTHGELDRAIIRRYIRRNIAKVQYCYEKELLARPTLAGTISITFQIDDNGHVTGAAATGMDETVASCVADVVKQIEFPHGGGLVSVSYPFTFHPEGTPAPTPDVAAAPAPVAEPPRADDPWSEEAEHRIAPLRGKLAEVMRAVRGGKTDKALDLARRWHDQAPGDVLALIAYGEALEAKRDRTQAARAYGSIIDLFSTRADLRRFAGERLERLGAPARTLVIDTYRRAVADRPDHVTGHRLLAYALLRSGDRAGAFSAILAGLDGQYPPGRFAGAERVLRDDAGMIGASYIAHGGNKAKVTAELGKRGLEPITQPSTRFILYWETDANDVDFHIRDSQGGHAWYQQMHLPSGGDLYADVTTGYGPECFAIDGTPSAGPYKLSINYFSQGPMGYGMGLLQAMKFDGKDMKFDDRPFVIMADHAFVDLGSY